MEDLSDKAKALSDYCMEQKRICPLPIFWNNLWKMLPDKKKNSSGVWSPTLPPALSGWRIVPYLFKKMFFHDHIKWADEHGVIDEVDTYLRSLSEEQWFHEGDYC